MFYEDVPRTIAENAKYRMAIRKHCSKDPVFRRQINAACREDVLFWLSTFCFLYEPRVLKDENGNQKPHIIPMIPWEHQEPIILQLREHLGTIDIGAEKSRGEGMSWMAILMACHDWIYEPMSMVGFVSRSEDMADSPDDPNSLLWKACWEIDQLPKWMGGVADKDYKRSRAAHTLLNLRNKSTIAAYSATGDVARGGRYKWFLMDELAAFKAGDDYKAIASTQYATNSRLYVSTPQGAQGAYYDIMHSPSNMLRLQMHWSQNPSRNRGLYRFVRGRIVEDDPENNPLPIGYAHDNEAMFHRLRVKGYNLEKGIRSPWYDNECDRPGATPTFVAQELDLDYSGSKHLVFGNDFFEVTDVTVRSPAAKGMFALHPETLDIQFDRQPDGQVELWCALDHRGRPPVGSYVVSADLGSGLGGSYASNSVCQVINTLTQEQVLEYATNTVQVSDFADICVGVAKWFWDAYLAWEVQGPGGAMTRRVVERGYGNVYRRTVLWKSGRKKVKEVGWNTDTRSKEVMFAELIRAVRAKEFTLRSKACVTECRQYIMINGKIEHSLAKVTTDDSSKGQAHGDRVIALAVGIQAAKDRPGPALKEHQDLEQNPPPNTMAYRMKLWEQQKQKDDDGWSELINGVQSNQGFSPSQLGTD